MHAQNPPQTYQQKVMLLKSRFKNTKDLWLFMTERRKCTGSEGAKRFTFPLAR
jgi:hypothetical protein